MSDPLHIVVSLSSSVNHQSAQPDLSTFEASWVDILQVVVDTLSSDSGDFFKIPFDQ